MADRIIAGSSLAAVSRWLNDSGIPPPRGTRKAKGHKTAKVYQWWPATVRDVLRSRSLLGEMTHDGSVVRGDDGMPVRYEPIITQDKWVRLQAALDAGRNPQRGERRNAAYLLRVAYCTCGEPFYQTQAGNGQRYYRCRSRMAGKPCGRRMIPLVALDAKVDEWVMSHPTFEVTETRIIHGNDADRALREVGQQIATLTTEHFVRGIVRDDYYEVMATLQTEYDRLSATDRTPTGRSPWAPAATCPRSGRIGTRPPSAGS